MSVWSLAWKVSQHERKWFWSGWAMFVLFFAMPLASGWALSRAFDAVSTGDTTSVLRWIGGFIVAEISRMATLHWAVMVWTRVWMHMQTFLRANLLVAQMASGGPEAGQPVGSAGEAVTHFRDDAEDVARLVDGLVDVSAGLMFTIVAAFVLGSANLAGALVLIGPLVLVAVATKSMDARIKRYRAADRAATAAVTGFVGDVMAAATTVKVNDASTASLDRLRGLVDRRRVTAVRDRVLEEAVQAISRGAADAGLGLVLLVGAGALASGRFDVGELALFVAYLGWLSFLPRMVGRVLARHKQAAVAFDRMSHLVADRDVRNTVRPRDLPINTGQSRDRPDAVRPARVPLERLDVVGLSAHYESGAGIDEVTVSVAKGELVVVTGPVGSGKSTLLRAVLGLAWQADLSGEVRWNGVRLDDPAGFLVPPNAAFLPQVPQLISDSLADNIGFGTASSVDVDQAISLAAMEADVAMMPDGSATLIGPRGLRLSGGQRQRLAGARAVVHRPELVVLDDLSSALDVETELQLWRNLADAGMTVLAVSHRAVAFERADRVVRLEGGRVAEITET
ncbi:MAG: ABC transporter ATP-binding protein [Ilumatobacteraceae bacterium]|nr:ABC transporter ATP-binding protein [Ilumatobacteraceae bacterium]